MLFVHFLYLCLPFLSSFLIPNVHRFRFNPPLKRNLQEFRYQFMAVEARHLNLFPSHLLCTREMLNPSMENVPNLQIDQAGVRVAPTSAPEMFLPFYNSQMMAKTMNNNNNSSQMANPPLKDDSGVTFNNSAALPFSRKRPREASNDFNTALVSVPNSTAGKVTSRCGSVSGSASSFSFLGEDLSLHLMQQQLEVDRLISLHMERVRLEMEERRRKQSRRVISVIEEAIAKKLREKEDQIHRIGKLNSELEDRVKSLYLENQIWRDLARTNEATANALRSNLEQLLAQVNNAGSGENEDAESCCGSSGEGAEVGCDEVDGDQVLRWRKVGGGGERKAEEEERKKRMCRRCGAHESSVLVLPCRHLCLCTGCGPTVDTCPICNSTKNASVHVNFS